MFYYLGLDGGLSPDIEKSDVFDKTVTMIPYAVALPEEDGRISDDYVQVGEAFELEL